MNVTGFSHQVGGHFGIFTCGGHICKPLNSKELAFYKEIGDRFAPFTAQCCGLSLITFHLSFYCIIIMNEVDTFNVYLQFHIVESLSIKQIKFFLLQKNWKYAKE